MLYRTEQQIKPVAPSLDTGRFRSSETPRLFQSAIYMLLLSCPLLVGCGGLYRGGVILPPAEKVILFDIEGPYGKEFTQVLSIELAGACKRAGKSIVVLSAKEVPSLADATQAHRLGSIVRDVEGQAYIKGTITGELSEALGKYYFAGNFQLYDAEKEGLIGGISDASYVAELDFDWRAGSEMSSWDAQRLYSTWARRVAVEMARGLGY